MKLFLYIGPFSPLLPILFFLLFKIKSKERSVWVIFLYTVYCLVNELISYYLQAIDSYYILHFFATFTLVEFSFISYFFYKLFKVNPILRKIITLSWILFTAYGTTKIVFSHELETWDSLQIGIGSLLILLYSSYFLFSKIKSGQTLEIYTTFHFWVAVTFLIYFSGTFFLNIMTQAMRKNPDYQLIYFVINNGFNILKNVLLAVAMVMKVNKISLKAAMPPDTNDELILQKVQ